MKASITIQIFFLSLLTSCLSTKSRTDERGFQVKLDSVIWTDNSRNRKIPVAFYTPQTDKKIANQKIVIFSHGYGENKGGDNLLYSYLTEDLASQGYFVASIQHELPTDSFLAMTGNLHITRRPNWERGAKNILYVLDRLKEIKAELDYKHLILIGHSNGGDMTVLFSHQYPDLVDKIISLDNRRMPLPRTNRPKIYSLRSRDQSADEGVLPTEEERKKFGMTIIKLQDTKHNQMDNDADDRQRREINSYVRGFLRK